MLTVTVDDSAFRAHMDRLQKSLGNMEPVLDSIGSKLETNIRNRFATKTDPNGKAWAPWTPSTIDNYASVGSSAAKKSGPGNGLLLDRYGTMLNSLSYQADAQSVRIGFGQAYAAYHEYGTQHMARRGMLMADPDQGTLSANDTADVLGILGVWLADLGS